MKPLPENVALYSTSMEERKRIAALLDFDAIDREDQEARQRFEAERDQRTREAKARCKAHRERRMGNTDIPTTPEKTP